MKLPRVPYKLTKNMSEVIAMRGINYSDMLRDGDLRESENLSARRYPYLSVRRGRETLAGEAYTGVNALAEYDGLITVKGGYVYYKGECINPDGEDGTPPETLLSEGEKQFAVVNNKVVIWPDKVYIDLSKDEETGEVKPTIKNATNSFRYRTAFTSNINVEEGLYYPRNQILVLFEETGTPQAPAEFDFSDYFKVGDAISISDFSNLDVVGSSDSEIDYVEGEKWTIVEITSARKMLLQCDNMREGNGQLNFRGTATISTYIPDLDFICEYNNRLYGCSNEDNSVYVSALGEPFQFFNFAGNVSTNSFAAAVGSDGKFTGCTRLGSSVLFWKEDKLHKLLGEYASEYTLYSYDIDGVQEGSHKSQQVINEVLYYLGTQGVYAYTGGLPELISDNFGQRRYKNGVAGHDADSYYLSVDDEQGESHLFVYETHAGLWLREDGTRVKDFARAGRELYMLDNGGMIHKLDSGKEDAGVEWMAQFTPFYETMQGRKVYSKLLIRAEIPAGAYIKPEVRFDGGDWKSLGAVTGGKDAKNDTVAIPIPISRCGKFELRLRGKGAVTVLGMVREFMVRSDK